jgi:hypothetical protein
MYARICDMWALLLALALPPAASGLGLPGELGVWDRLAYPAGDAWAENDPPEAGAPAARIPPAPGLAGLELAPAKEGASGAMDPPLPASSGMPAGCRGELPSLASAGALLLLGAAAAASLACWCSGPIDLRTVSAAEDGLLVGVRPAPRPVGTLGLGAAAEAASIA